MHPRESYQLDQLGSMRECRETTGTSPGSLGSKMVSWIRPCRQGYEEIQVSNPC